MEKCWSRLTKTLPADVYKLERRCVRAGRSVVAGVADLGAPRCQHRVYFPSGLRKQTGAKEKEDGKRHEEHMHEYRWSTLFTP